MSSTLLLAHQFGGGEHLLRSLSYASVNCTLSLLKSSLRKSPLLMDDEYARQGSEDSRFADYFGTIRSVVTSSGNNDSGMFETNLREERCLPFEGAGAESTWRLELPAAFRQFDYNMISDVILHVRYTARQGGAQLREGAVARIQELIEAANTSGLVQLFSLKHDFPTEWHQFMYPATAATSQELTLKLDKRLFPFMLKDRRLDVQGITVALILDDATVYSGGSNLSITFVHPNGSQTTDDLAPLETIGNQPSKAFSTNFVLEQDPKEIAVKVDEASLSSVAPALVEERDGKKRPSSDQVKDMLFVVNYTIAS